MKRLFFAAFASAVLPLSAVAQVVSDCDWIANPANIAEPWETNSRTYANGTIRVVDSSQYQARTDGFDFEVITGQFAQSLSPGNEQRDYWSSASADRRGSRNLIGIKDEAVDTLVEAIVFAKDRETLVAACKALDRVLLWNHFVVPQFYSPDIRTARWNRFSRPETMPDYRFTTDTWWWDAEKAGSIKGAD